MTRTSLARAALAAVALLFAAVAAGAAPSGGNLLLNPDFEQSLGDHPWMPAAWDTSASGLESVYFGRDTLLSEHGRYAVSVANVSVLHAMAHNWNQAVLVGREAWGKEAVLSVWTRSNGLLGRAYIMVQAYRDTVSKMAAIWKIDHEDAYGRLHINKIDDPLLDLGWRRGYFSDPETGWVKRTVRVFVPPSVNVLFVRLGMTGTGQVMFDNASLTLEAPERPAPLALHTNLLKDAGFEGDGNEWEYSVPPYAGFQLVRDTLVVRTGHAAVRMEGGLEGMVKVRAGVGQPFADHRLAGKRVRLSAYVKTDSLKGSAYLMLYAHTVSGAKFEPAPKQFSGTGDWELATTEMDLPPDTYEVWAWCVYNAPAEGRLYYDDCSFEILGPAKPPAKPPAKH